jgi:hypothetical protein
MWPYRPGEVEILIIGHEVETIGSKTFVLYTLKCSALGKLWLVKKRYSEFFDFHEKLMNTSCSKNKIPKMPGKMVFGNLKEENISKRLTLLDDYIQELLRNESDLMSTSEVKDLFFNFFIPK